MSFYVYNIDIPTYVYGIINIRGDDFMALDYNTQIRKFIDKYEKIINNLQNEIKELKEQIEQLQLATSEIIQDNESEI